MSDPLLCRECIREQLADGSQPWNSRQALTVWDGNALCHAHLPQPSTDAAALLGKRVRVHLEEKVVVTGILLGFGTSGEFEVIEADGDVHYCWPLLSIEEDRNEPFPPGRREGSGPGVRE